jgi:hypothetical protein
MKVNDGRERSGLIREKIPMTTSPPLTRRGWRFASGAARFAPAIARAARRGVSDTEIIVGRMADLSGMTAAQW